VKGTSLVKDLTSPIIKKFSILGLGFASRSCADYFIVLRFGRLGGLAPLRFMKI
jgi:hypothetical protein